MTYPSRDELRRAYEEILSLEKSIHEQLRREDPDLDRVSNWVSEQDELMDAIEESGDLDQRVRGESPGWFRELIQSLQELRNRDRRILRDRMDELETRMNVLDQSVQLMSHYMQGEKRREERSVQRLDREA